MKTITAIAGVAFAACIALSAAAVAQDARADAVGTAQRQQRGEGANGVHRGVSSAHPLAALRRGTRSAGHVVTQDTRRAGHAIHRGLRATGHAIHRGVRATGHAVHRGVARLAGK
jgi:hypothetical protein